MKAKLAAAATAAAGTYLLWEATRMVALRELTARGESPVPLLVFAADLAAIGVAMLLAPLVWGIAGHNRRASR